MALSIVLISRRVAWCVSHFLCLVPFALCHLVCLVTTLLMSISVMHDLYDTLVHAEGRV